MDNLFHFCLNSSSGMEKGCTCEALANSFCFLKHFTVLTSFSVFVKFHHFFLSQYIFHDEPI